MLRTSLALAAFSSLALATSAAAQTAPDWFVRVGPALVTLEESAEMRVNGALAPGADVSIEDETTLAVEIGRFITPNIAVSLTGGYPPTFEVESAGTLSGLGRDGDITGGPAALTAHYHLNRGGRLQPYAGAGVALMYVFDTEDGLVTDVEVDSAFGPAVQLGVNYDVTPTFGVFADYKKAWISTEARGNFGGAPMTADIQLDPAVFNAGLFFRF